jgi:hypothetical protein
MLPRHIDMIGDERAPLAGVIGPRRQHEVIDGQLAAAIRSLTDRRVLMVLNTHYGDRNFPPFDPAHKAGPLQFNLSPNADQKKASSRTFCIAPAIC